jgi:hypothetical protein
MTIVPSTAFPQFHYIKKARDLHHGLFSVPELKPGKVESILSGMNCFNRANICASSTVGANIGIDLVDVTFGDRVNGALVNAAAASSAIFIYNISHCSNVFGF